MRIGMTAAPPEGRAGNGLPRTGLRTPANALTGLRLAAAPVAALAVRYGASRLALALFVLAVATDLLDGPLARRRGEASALGGFFDHATDATFVSLGLLACATRGLVPWLLPLCVAVAFLQYALDSRALEGRPLHASALGRWNGIAYFVALGVPVVRNGLGIGWPPDGLVLAIGWLLVASSLLSMTLRGRAWLAARRA
jgi:phosphatidylglycerophosphate synthase